LCIKGCRPRKALAIDELAGDHDWLPSALAYHARVASAIPLAPRLARGF
jgi:hypothetical protein